MIKVLTFLITILVSNVFIAPSAQAAQEIIISETTHRLSDGVFVDDELALKLAPNGELGLLVYTLSRNLRSWQVDPATISEIVAMSNGYGIKDGTVPAGQQIAKDWLTQFIKVSKNEKISALTYGNPSNYWVDQLVKERLIYLQASGEILLESLLGRAVDQEIKLEPVEEPILIKGNFSKGILVIHEEANLNAEVMDMLVKMLNACGHSMSEVGLLAAENLENRSLEEFKALNAHVVLKFGRIKHPINQLPISSYEIHTEEETEYLFADALTSISEDKALKRKLWTALQLLFNLSTGPK